MYKEERLDPPEQVCFRVGYGINYVETFKYGYECLIDSNRTKNKCFFLAMGKSGKIFNFLIDFKICHESIDILQLSPEGEVNSGWYIYGRELSRYISSAAHRP